MTGSISEERCLTYKNFKIQPYNACSKDEVALSIPEHSEQDLEDCLHCKIQDIAIAANKKCQKFFACLSFVFDNNTFFEQFFHQNPTIIRFLNQQMQPKSKFPILVITIESYNLTELSLEYLNSLLHIDKPSYKILYVKFIKPLSNTNMVNLKNDFDDASVKNIRLSFSCNHHTNDNEWIEYMINPNKINPNRSVTCKESNFSVLLNPIINSTSNITTVDNKFHFTFINLLEKLRSFLIYILISFFILLLCGVMISYYIFFGFNNRRKHQQINQDLNTRSSVTSTDTSDTVETNENSSSSNKEANTRILT
ncbi:unnamed protein product [Adineta steineri]|uniref:Uncharacterized protein n=1 Tax=Adineta steineri TaxID=433720 RepID=A0A819XCZ1_9BILA|nr:unnamed protein product [Adineta steineri]CAF4140306.1 unnamed protein product [Adineta steineri]